MTDKEQGFKRIDNNSKLVILTKNELISEFNTYEYVNEDSSYRSYSIILQIYELFADTYIVEYYHKWKQKYDNR